MVKLHRIFYRKKAYKPIAQKESKANVFIPMTILKNLFLPRSDSCLLFCTRKALVPIIMKITLPKVDKKYASLEYSPRVTGIKQAIAKGTISLIHS
ncbi:MAG: hypothetical protein K6F01_03415 [Selenomonas sp.]|uniref:hypothetical protein n=1 Tax=Selenomonas sp. TaxID=2053611 RepID=UPI0025E46BC2|nr:hypothetical protein [Selenomonas sp.]MCR5438477.1 hypothetical protein [Selenomonas sp.]